LKYEPTPFRDGKGRKEKVFCVGLNKTGTTSLEAALQSLGYLMGRQPRGERLLPHWLRGNFDPIIEFCKTADAFQDIPFSLPGTFRALDKAYPTAKFVLTLRNSVEQWLASAIDFASLSYGRLPTTDELRADTYAYPGFMYDAQVGVVPGATDSDPWNIDALVDFYQSHNDAVIAHFGDSDRLLVLNVADEGSYQNLCAFLDRSPVLETMPHMNATPREQG
jgi:hypothetical protein